MKKYWVWFVLTSYFMSCLIGTFFGFPAIVRGSSADSVGVPPTTYMGPLSHFYEWNSIIKLLPFT